MNGREAAKMGQALISVAQTGPVSPTGLSCTRQGTGFSVASHLLAQLAKHSTALRPNTSSVLSLGYVQAGEHWLNSCRGWGQKGYLYTPWFHIQNEASCFNSALTLPQS